MSSSDRTSRESDYGAREITRARLNLWPPLSLSAERATASESLFSILIDI